MADSDTIDPLIAVVDFHHARGPEVELWLGAEQDEDPAPEIDWSLLPFMALSDGCHTSTEDFAYFTLKQNATQTRPARSLFGISCARQVDAGVLKNKSADVTRSTVQKAVAVITDEPQRFGHLRESLAVVTSAWFAQGDFSDIEILKSFRESLASSHSRDDFHDQSDAIGLSLREIIHEFKYQTLVMFKCCLLQPKMLFFGSRCERLCLMQFALISLIPGLIRSLEDCADPAFDHYSESVAKATSLKTSERGSLLAYMGLPLQLFGKGSFFGPYTPLQQLDILADYGTKSYVVGSTNPLLLQQRDKYCDILVNLDETSVNITSVSLRSALSLSAADRRWIDFLTQTVQETWDPLNPSRPVTLGYAGSEDFIRTQFEEYLLALISSVSYQNHWSSSGADGQPRSASTGEPEEDPCAEFSTEFIHAWKQSSNYSLFDRLTSGSRLFDIVEPKHPTAGGLGVEDVQRRLAQQIAELHLDERVREGKDTVGRHLAFGKERFGQFSNKLWADIEALREAQRKRSADRSMSVDGETTGTGAHMQQGDGAGSETDGKPVGIPRRAAWPTRAQAPDLTQMQANAKDASAKAGAYLSSWGSWARDKGKEWQEKRGTASPTTISSPVKSVTSPTTNVSAALQGRSSLSPTGSEFSGGGGVGQQLPGELGPRWNDVVGRSKDEGMLARSGFEDSPATGATTASEASPLSPPPDSALGSKLGFPTATSTTTTTTDDGGRVTDINPTTVELNDDDERALYNTAWMSPR